MPVFTVRIHSAGCLHSAMVYGLAYGLGLLGLAVAATEASRKARQGSYAVNI